MATPYEIVSYISLALIILSFIVSLPLTFVAYKRLTRTEIRRSVVSWLRAILTVLVLHLLLRIVCSIILRTVRSNPYGYINAVEHVSQVANVLGKVVSAGVVLIQFHLALTARRSAGVDASRSHTSRIIFILGFSVVAVLAVIQLILFEVAWYSYGLALSLALLVITYISGVTIFAGALFTLIYTIVRVRRTTTRRLFKWLLAINIITLVREAWQIIYFSIVFFAPIFGVRSSDLVAFTVIDIIYNLMNPVSIVVVLSFVYVVLSKRNEGWWVGRTLNKPLH